MINAGGVMAATGISGQQNAPYLAASHVRWS
jgi:hypothetical protein